MNEFSDSIASEGVGEKRREELTRKRSFIADKTRNVTWDLRLNMNNLY